MSAEEFSLSTFHLASVSSIDVHSIFRGAMAALVWVAFSRYHAAPLQQRIRTVVGDEAANTTTCDAPDG